MNPYEAPNSETPEPNDLPKGKGKVCKFCGSENIYEPDLFSRRKPNIIFFLLVGWIYLLGRYAFEIKTDGCEDCGETHKYKPIGSYIAMIFFLLIVTLIVMALVTHLIT